MAGLIDHLLIAPILLPLGAAALLLFLDDRPRAFKVAISLASTLGLLVLAVILLVMADAPASNTDVAAVSAYPLGNWPVPFGIVLVLDRLTAIMLMLTAVVAGCALVSSLARWDRAGVYFHPLFQLLLVGVNGAFLTGDVFNLFVFFEVMLAASYGLVLHGSGPGRVKAGMHYIAFNLATAFIFLTGVTLLYAVTGTLNLADMAARIPQVPEGDRALLEAGGAILGIAFLVKSGMWPLSFWLPTAYAAAAPPVAAVFAILSKVGIYVVMRLWLLLFGEGAGESAFLGGQWMMIGGMATMAFGSIGVMAAQDLTRTAGYSVLISSGTLLAILGAGQEATTGSALYYMATSTLTIAVFFLLIELAERGREAGADIIAVTLEAYGDPDSEETEEIGNEGVAVPAILVMLGVAFVAVAVLLAGLPPLSGFIAKFAIMTAMLNPAGLEVAHHVSISSWIILGLLIFSGLAVLIAMTRAGIRTFWAPMEREVPRVRFVEMAPVLVLLFLCLVLTAGAAPVMRFMDAAAHSLHAQDEYVRGVTSVTRTGAGGAGATKGGGS